MGTCVRRWCFSFREYDGVNSTNPESYFKKQTLILKETLTSEPWGFPWERLSFQCWLTLLLPLLNPQPQTHASNQSNCAIATVWIPTSTSSKCYFTWVDEFQMCALWLGGRVGEQLEGGHGLLSGETQCDSSPLTAFPAGGEGAFPEGSDFSLMFVLQS